MVVVEAQSFCPKKYRLTFITIIAFILTTVLISISIIISDPDVLYPKIWFIGSIICNILLISYILYIFYMARKVTILSCSYDRPLLIRFTSSTFTFIFFGLISLFLIAFGLSSITKNEIINEDPEYVSSILYFYKDLVNDNIAIFSVVVGFIVILLTVSDYVFC